MLKHYRFLLVILSVFYAHQAVAHGDELKVHHLWVKATIPGTSTTAAYFELTNHSHNDVTLQSVSSDVSERVEIHEHKQVDGLMKMQKVKAGVTVKADSSVSFEPGGYHIMFLGVKEPVSKGDKVNITLQFSHGKTLKLRAVAKAASAKKHHHHH